MSDLSSITIQDTVQSGDTFLIYSGTNASARRVSLNTVASAVDAINDASLVPIALPSYSAAELLDGTTLNAVTYARHVVYCSNGNAGAACLAVSNGTSWVRVVFGATVAAS